VSDGGRAAPTAPSSEPAWPAEDADREVAAALSRGETRRAIALCEEQHALPIGRLCMAMLGSQNEADELTLETLLEAHQSFDEFRGQASLRAWLLGIARHKCLERLAKSRRPGISGPLDRADTAESVDEVPSEPCAESARALLENLRPSDREALLLRYAIDLSFEEVAAASGIDARAARQRVSRALLHLRNVMESEDGDG
jgi:RNA polymerase sigma-70 factor (ECF subfamily)